MDASINLFGKTIHLYGILCMIGLALAIVLVVLLAKKQKFEFFDFTLVILVTLISAFIGAKLLFLIVSWDSVVELFKTYPLMQALASVLQGGFVFYGGLIGGGLGLFIFTKLRKENMFKYSNLFTLALPLGHAFGRIGCFVAGCCYGTVYNGPLGYTYTTSLDSATPLGVSLLPVQLIEAVALFILFVSLIIVYLKFNKKQYLVTTIYLVVYATIRFTLEFFRGDMERGLLLGLSTSQWISIAIVMGVVVCVVINLIKQKKSQANQKNKS